MQIINLLLRTFAVAVSAFAVHEIGCFLRKEVCNEGNRNV